MLNRLAIKEIKNCKSQTIMLGLTSLLGSISIVGQAWYFANLINNFIFHEATLESETDNIIGLAVFVILRLIFHYLQEKVANQLAHATKASLRHQVLIHMFSQGLQHRESHGDMIHLIADGLDQVEAYIARYIPQILYAAIIPLVMGVAIIDSVPWIGIILLLTVPLIPFFMILIGKQAEKMNQEQWERMSFLSGHFLDMLQGLATLKVFGRSKEQTSVIGRLSGEFRDSTLRVLRVAFLSALVLELVSTISTALIAVYLGVTLLYRGIEFLPAFFILLLAPEFYTPFRQLGAAFHTGMAGQSSLLKIDEFLQSPGQLHEGGSIELADPIHSIEYKELSYTYPHSHNGVSDITISLTNAERVMLVGESGAGKTTLAHLLAGFLKPERHTLFVNGVDLCDISMEWWREQLVYVSQRPHIFKGTLREAITFGLTVSDEDLIEACKAAEIYDLIQSKDGQFDFEVGEGGLGLSGGEKQRIALARAFLRKGSVLILDEVTAHLDVKTEESISRALQRLMTGKLVLLIGHRLQTMSWANTLYVLRQGRVEESGTYDELIGKHGYFYELIKAGTGRFVEDMTENQDTVERQSVVKGSLNTNSLANSRPNTVTSYPISVKPVVDTVSKQSSFMGKLGLLFSVLSPAKWSLVLAFIFAFLTVFMNVGLLSTSSWLLASAALHPGIHYLSISIVGVRFFGISRAVCRYFERYTSHHMAFQGLYGLRVWFYEHLEPLGPAIFKRFGAGDLLGRIMSDIEVLQFFYLRVLIPPMAAVVLTILVMMGVGYISTTLIWIVLAAFVIGAILIPIYVYQFNKKSLVTVATVQGQVKREITDMLDGLGDIIAYGQRQHAYESITKAFQVAEDAKHRISEGTNQGNISFMGLVQVTMIITAIVAAGVLEGTWASVYVAVAAIGVQAWFEALQPMTIALHHGYESAVAVNRLHTLGTSRPAVVEATNPLLIDSGVQAIDDIVLDHLSFGYDDTKVYNDLSMTIKSGESVAIVGASGSGKTTLINILERFYDYEGSIRVNNHDLKDYDIESWRSQISVISQDTYIFHATVEENIRLANPYVEESVLRDAIEWASLTTLVNRLPNGLQTVVGAGGMGLSGGERQRIALARMYLRQSPVLLLDEPLEGLDQVTRNDIHRKLMTFIKGHTAIYITHHLEGIDQMDRIVFMEQGQIIESGTYEELIVLRGKFWEYCCLSMARI